uniref:Uncharacterized protein n=1 Tax=Arundo donax TaxID=35708 RepID=A0A0A9CQD5_ARUDO
MLVCLMIRFFYHFVNENIYAVVPPVQNK